MHTPCPMANGPKIINLQVTAAAVLVFSSLLVVVPTIDARSLAENNVHPKEIFILAGQSNMAGRGGLMYIRLNHSQYFDPQFTPADGRPDPTRIFRLNAQLGWEVAKDPLHVDIDPKTCGVGPGMTFANAIKGRVGPTIGLVPCAVGDTGISQWQRGEALYNNMTKRAKAAVQGGGEIKALLWYQGEKDTANMDMVNSYKGKMERLIQNVREDLNLPSLPIIQVAIATDGPSDMTCMESLRTIQKSINLPNVVTVDAKGLPNNGKHDEVHLSTEGQVRMGYLLAQAYLDHFLAPASSP